jgi:putative FmdB family regulatory protein
MPIYEYRCSSCGHELEAMQKFSDAALTQCPQCRTDTLVKLVSAAGFQLKGGGWYATDFRGSGSKPASKPDSKPESGEAKSGGDSDSAAKPAAACGGNCACH